MSRGIVAVLVTGTAGVNSPHDCSASGRLVADRIRPVRATPPRCAAPMDSRAGQYARKVARPPSCSSSSTTMPRPPLFGLSVQTIYRQTMLHHPIDRHVDNGSSRLSRALWAIASSLTPRGHAGKLVFDSKRCAGCHSGTDFTDDRVHDVGTIGASSGQGSGTTLAGINTPTLEGLWLSAPYLHNGSLATLAEVLADVTHMRSELTAPSKADLEAYLLQIDANSESPRLAQAQAQGNAQSATYRVNVRRQMDHDRHARRRSDRCALLPLERRRPQFRRDLLERGRHGQPRDRGGSGTGEHGPLHD